jgi:hypothetical protein
MKKRDIYINLAIQLIEKDINWHKTEPHENKEFKNGFIKGMEQAVYLIKNIYHDLRVEEEK